MQTQNLLLLNGLNCLFSRIGGKFKAESSNENVTRAQQLNSAQLYATVKSNA